jgi:hypothetical protein
MSVNYSGTRNLVGDNHPMHLEFPLVLHINLDKIKFNQWRHVLRSVPPTGMTFVEHEQGHH